MEQIATPVVMYRGGTSKALFVKSQDLPTANEAELDDWIRAIYGSPDRRQIDGLGGADALTSKFAIIGPPTRPDADVDYTFFQVGIESPQIFRDINCGNISAAVGPFAIDEGLVEATDPVTMVRIHATNFSKIIYAEVPVLNGRAKILGDQRINGVPGTGAPIHLDFRATAGGRTGQLLPTGNPRDNLVVDGLGTFEVSFVDLANLVCYLPAQAVGLTGTEDPADLSQNASLMRDYERIRLTAAVHLGLAPNLDAAYANKPGTPHMSLVGSPSDWIDHATREPHTADECDLVARLFTRGYVHKTYPGTSSACAGAAAMLPGTIPNQLVHPDALKAGRVRIGHPCGTLDVSAAIKREIDGQFTVQKAALIRTARRLMEGRVFASIGRLPWYQPN